MFLQILTADVPQDLVNSAPAQMVQGQLWFKGHWFNPQSLPPSCQHDLEESTEPHLSLSVEYTERCVINCMGAFKTCRVSEEMLRRESNCLRSSHLSASNTTRKQRHLLSELISQHFVLTHTWNYVGSGQRCHHLFFGLSISFSHTQIRINAVGRVPEPDIEGSTLPFFFFKCKSDPFSNETHSFLPHFIIFPLVYLSLLLCVLLLALWISKCSIWFPPSLIIEATVIQDLPPSAPSVPDPCFSSFLGNRLHIVRHQ